MYRSTFENNDVFYAQRTPAMYEIVTKISFDIQDLQKRPSVQKKFNNTTKINQKVNLRKKQVKKNKETQPFKIFRNFEDSATLRDCNSSGYFKAVPSNGKFTGSSFLKCLFGKLHGSLDLSLQINIKHKTIVQQLSNIMKLSLQ